MKNDKYLRIKEKLDRRLTVNDINYVTSRIYKAQLMLLERNESILEYELETEVYKLKFTDASGIRARINSSWLSIDESDDVFPTFQLINNEDESIKEMFFPLSSREQSNIPPEDIHTTLIKLLHGTCIA